MNDNMQQNRGATPGQADTQADTPDIQGSTQAEAQPQVKLTSKQMWKKILLETADMLRGAAFPFIVMCVLSSLIIIFATYTETDLVIQLIAVIGGEGLLVAALVMFGRSNGSEAYKVMTTNKTKRRLKNPDEKVVFKTGEYAPWKGFVIGFITTIPYLVFAIIACFGEFEFVEFMLEYAFGWAAEPLNMIGNVPEPLYLLMAILPIGILGGCYIYGRYWEENRQKKINRAEDDRRKGKKKHYYEENNYEEDRVVVDSKKGKRK